MIHIVAIMAKAETFVDEMQNRLISGESTINVICALRYGGQTDSRMLFPRIGIVQEHV